MGTSTSSGSTPGSINDLSKILAKAWTDDGFKSNLQRDPVSTAERERVDIRPFLPTGYKEGDKISVNIPNPPPDLNMSDSAQVSEAASTSLSSGAEMF